MNPVITRSLLVPVSVFAFLGLGCGTPDDRNKDETPDATVVVSLTGMGGIDSRAAAVADGFVVGNVDAAGTATVARFNDGLQAAWAVKIEGLPGFRSVTADSEGRVVVVGQTGDGPARIVRLNGDGTLDAAVGTADRIFIGDVVALSDGRMMFSDTMLVDADFKVRSTGNGPGERIVPVSDGYLVLHRNGLHVRRLDEDGRMRWETKVTVPNATYSTIGVRMLDDGTILAAVSGDLRIGSPLVTAHLDADGNVLAVNKPRFDITAGDGDSGPVQFGKGLQMTQRGDQTYASFAALDGGGGVRARLTVELDGTGDVVNAFVGGGGVTMLGDRLVGASDSIIATKTMASSCLTSVTFENEALVPGGTPSVPSSILPDVVEYGFAALTTITVTPVDVASERTCRAAD